jgi:hypothetical protein
VKLGSENRHPDSHRSEERSPAYLIDADYKPDTGIKVSLLNP